MSDLPAPSPTPEERTLLLKFLAKLGQAQLAGGNAVPLVERDIVLIARQNGLHGVTAVVLPTGLFIEVDDATEHKLDLAIEYDARDRLNRGIAKCREKGDEGTRVLLDRILADEEGGIDWLEAQLHIIGQIGKELYLAQQIR